MSTSTSSSNGTTIVTGPNVIQKSDFFVHAGILHPLVVGSIAVFVVFFYLRLGSNRSVAPITVFDWIINVALGSTLAGIVNGNSLVRGLIAVWTMLGFQYVTSFISSHYKQRFEWIFHAPPIVVVFHGNFLHKEMGNHRISESDIYSALRQQGLLHIEQVEAVIIEANGCFSIFSQKAVEDCEWKPMALLKVPAYKALCESDRNYDPEKSKNSKTDTKGSESTTNPALMGTYDQIAHKNERPDGTGWNMRSILPV